VILFTSLVGVIVDRFGYSALFVFCALACTVALERLLHMHPRQAGVGMTQSG
jgi:hypothetical protein